MFNKIIKQIAPPFLLNFVRFHILHEQKEPASPYFWEGIYKHYSNVPMKNEGYSASNFFRFSENHCKQIMERAPGAYEVPSEVRGEFALLPLLTAAVVNERKRPVRILDFGGVVGAAYVQLKQALPDVAVSEYHVVELPETAMAGSKLFCNDKTIKFHADIPKDVEIDIIVTNCTLQYIADYKTMLNRLMDLRATYILFLRLTAGKIPTYASAQLNVQDVVIAHWFFNLEEIIKQMEKSDYRLAWRALHDRVFNQDNFPASHRMGRPCNLLFTRVAH